MRKAILLVIALISTVTLASAWAQIDVDPKSLDIPVGGIGTYTLTLNTSDVGKQDLTFITSNESILARFGTTGDFKETNTMKIDSMTGNQTFTLQIQPQDGVTTGQAYDVSVIFGKIPLNIKAVVTATGGPVPELSTGLLMTAGLVGMIALVRRQRRD